MDGSYSPRVVIYLYRYKGIQTATKLLVSSRNICRSLRLTLRVRDKNQYKRHYENTKF